MSNEIKTHRLIVTLPDTSGEEADTIANNIERILRNGRGPGATVTHALGESLPDGVNVWREDDAPDWTAVSFDGNRDINTAYHFRSLEIRQLAGVLLALAEEIGAAE